jgi:hypothetical protein
MCGGGKVLVRGGQTGPCVNVDGFGEGECECDWSISARIQ